MDAKDTSSPRKWAHCICFPLRNRWCRLATYMLTNFVGASIIFGWGPMSAMLFRSGAYRWQCDESWLDSHSEPCAEQYHSVQALLTTALFGISIGSLLAGICYDKLQPIFMSIIGPILFSIGWIALVFSSQNVQLYIPAFLFAGLSVNYFTFASMVACGFFPNRPGLVISLIIASQGVSTVVPVGLEQIWNILPTFTFQSIALGYLIVVLLPVELLFILSFPMKRSPNVEFFENLMSLDTTGENIEFEVDEISKDKLDLYKSNIFTQGVSSPSGGPKDDKDHPSSPGCLSDVPMTPVGMPSKVSPVNATPRTLPTKFVNFEGKDDGKPFVSFFLGPETSLVVMGDVSRCMDSPGAFRSNWRQFGREMCTLEVVFFTIFYAITLLSVGYYPTTIQALHGDKITHFYGFITPLQVLPSLCLGLLVDYTGSLPIAISLATANLIVFAFAYYGTYSLQYAAVVLHIYCMSFIYTVKHTYIQEVFATPNFGVIVGVISAISGLMLPLNIIMQNLLDYNTAFICYLCAGGICLPVLIFLFTRMVLGRNYKHFHNTKDSNEACREWRNSDATTNV